MLANVLASGTVSVLPLVSGAVEEGLLRWLRAAELTCDRAALLVAQASSCTRTALCLSVQHWTGLLIAYLLIVAPAGCALPSILRTVPRS